MIEEDQRILMEIKSFLQRNTMFQLAAEADTVETGLALVQHERPDVVMMNLGLPGMDGIRVTRQIKQINPDIKVIILTSHEIEEEILAALSAGADAYCQKNVISDQLPFIIRCVQEGGAWLDPAIARTVVRLISSGQTLGASPASETDDATRQKPSEKKAPRLTERECRILGMIVDGKNNSEIAQTLHISYHTVKSDVTNILHKLAVHDRVQAAVKALRENLI